MTVCEWTKLRMLGVVVATGVALLACGDASKASSTGSAQASAERAKPGGPCDELAKVLPKCDARKSFQVDAAMNMSLAYVTADPEMKEALEDECRKAMAALKTDPACTK